MIGSEQFHATCVSVSGKGVLLLGDSGCGKSDLALRLIDRGAVLVGDDYVLIHKNGNSLLASPVLRLAGIMEIRGIGILEVPYLQGAALSLAVKLVARNAVERMPEAPEFFDCLDVKVPLVSLHAFDSSTPAKIRAILQYSAA